MRTLTWSSIVLLLSANATSSYLRRDGFLVPTANRIVQINFFVDNKNLLARDFLEITVVNDRYRKHIVDVHRGAQSLLGTGNVEIMVPDGSVKIVVCALVDCPFQETEMVCGDTRVPSQIAVDKIHEVTFSTERACQFPPSSLIAKSW